MADWRNRIIERRTMRIGDIRPNKWNPKGHPRVQQERLRAVLDKFGIVGDLIAFKDTDGEYTLFDGHARQTLDPDQEWPILFTDLTRQEIDELVLYFDPLAALARQEADKTAALMADLKVQERALREMLEEQAQALGFAYGKNGKEGPPPPEPEIDRAQELQDIWQVKPGDVWQAGEHFIICGDCRDFGTWQKLLAAAGVEKVNGVFTSPPYAEQRKQQYGGVPTDEYVDWWEDVQANVRANLAKDGSFFVNIKPHCEGGQRVLYVFDLVLAMVRRWGWRFVDELCWIRNSLPGQFSGRFKNQWESIYHFAQSEHKFRPSQVVRPFKTDPNEMHYYSVSHDATLGDSYRGTAGGKDFSVKSKNYDGALPGNVLQIETGWQSKGMGTHGAVFPVALPAFFIRAYSDPGDVWLDCFLGSGTTICAAHQNGRRGLGIETLEKYVAVSLQRLQDMGLDPRLVE